MVTRALTAIAMLVMPFLLTGLITRVKSLWSGRRGAPLLQPAFDALRLLRKSSVYSETTTPLFRIAPWISLVTTLGSALVTPLLGVGSAVSFSYDFVWLAYAWGLGRMAMMLAALDTGSSFEGMGAAREATFATLLEPALFLVVGALCLVTGASTFEGALGLQVTSGNGSLVVWLCSVVALFIFLQAETARMPIDDPTTHLELTMVHEVMVLDHSGPDLAAIQYGAALKLYVGASVLATLLNPWGGEGPLVSASAHLALCAAIAALLGTIESLIARFKLSAVPKYLAVAVVSAAVALLATAWRAGGVQ